MDTSKAVSEPLRRIIEHHNAFNRRIKLLFGSLNKVMSDGLAEDLAVALPYGDEPWGEPKRWSSSMDGHAAVKLLAEMGIVRAASAFEHYLQGVIAELDRGEIPSPAEAVADSVDRILTRLSFDASDRPSLYLVRLFDCARNCIVHQMGRANNQLRYLSATRGLAEALASSTPRARAKWKPAIPAISPGDAVPWMPRHAILASDAYYKAAVAIDRKLVAVLGDGRLVAMAAYWAVAAPMPVVTAKKSLVATLRSALDERYRVKVKAAEIAPLLKSVGKWEHAKSSFHERNPSGALT